MTFLWIVCASLLLIVWVLTAIDIRRRRLGAGKAVGWLLVALLVPFLGAAVYWALRKPDDDDRERAAAAQASLRSDRERRSTDSTRPF
jgi:uncharacterized membrane protein YhaH (DUF805 family)